MGPLSAPPQRSEKRASERIQAAQAGRGRAKREEGPVQPWREVGELGALWSVRRIDHGRMTDPAHDPRGNELGEQVTEFLHLESGLDRTAPQAAAAIAAMVPKADIPGGPEAHQRRHRYQQMRAAVHLRRQLPEEPDIVGLMLEDVEETDEIRATEPGISSCVGVVAEPRFEMPLQRLEGLDEAVAAEGKITGDELPEQTCTGADVD